MRAVFLICGRTVNNGCALSPTPGWEARLFKISNASMVSRAEAFIKAMNGPVQVITVGRKGRDLMIRRGYNVVATFEKMPDPPSILDVTAIAQLASTSSDSEALGFIKKAGR